jgi:outer membrane protein assembly factor BamA
MFRTPVLLLIIYSLFSIDVTSQTLNLKITSTDSIENKVIDSIKYIKKHQDYESATKEVSVFKTKLNSIGYIESNISPIKKTNDSSLLVTVKLNRKFEYINIYYNDSLIPRNIIQLVSNKISDTYFSIPIEDTEKALNTINLKLSELGDPFSTLKLSNIRVKNNSEIDATLVLSDKVMTRYIDKVIIKGYEKFPKSYLKYYLKIKEGQVFNLSEIKKQARSLNELPFANQIKDPEILFSKDSTTLYLFINKSKSNNFDGFIGFGSNEDSNKIEFSGYLNLELNNNLNYGESLRLIYKSDENEQKTFNVNINLPYLFGTPLGTELELRLLKRDSSFSTATQNAKLYYQLNPKNKVFAGISSIQSNNLLDSIYSDPLIKDYSTLFYNVRYLYQKRQKESVLFNTSSLLDLQVEIGSRDYENASTKQYQYYIDAFHIFNLNLKNSIYLRVKSIGLFSDTYLENELFYFGGINSIRGFEENSIPATLYGLLNTEYRYLFNNNIYVHTIIDAAYFENDITDQKEKLYGFGFGFGLITKAGLLKFNFANGKTENQSFKFSNSQVHLSLTAFF